MKNRVRTSSGWFAQAFCHLPGFTFAHLQTMPDPKHLGAQLSMGYGFIGFGTIEAAQKAWISQLLLSDHLLFSTFLPACTVLLPSDRSGIVCMYVIITDACFQHTRGHSRCSRCSGCGGHGRHRMWQFGEVKGHLEAGKTIL